jgi:hypothetical protein
VANLGALYFKDDDNDENKPVWPSSGVEISSHHSKVSHR